MEYETRDWCARPRIHQSIEEMAAFELECDCSEGIAETAQDNATEAHRAIGRLLHVLKEKGVINVNEIGFVLHCPEIKEVE